MKYNISIRGTIGGWYGISAESVSDYLDRHKNEEIHLAICSLGGDVAEGLQMYQALKDHGNVHAHIIGMTASAATIVAMGAKSIEMAKASLFLIHNASAFVFEWRSANKEQLAQILDKYKKTRDDLNTIDDLIASIYADKCGKSLEEIHGIMNEGKWLKAEDVKNLGLIDSIRENDEDDKKISADMQSLYFNSMVKNFGLPAIAEAPVPVADSNGNPTDSFLEKTVKAVKDFFSKPEKDSKVNKMNKFFTNICELLGVKNIECSDDAATIKVTDIEKVENHIVDLKGQLEAANTAKDDLQKKLDEANTTIENLKGSAGEEPDDVPEKEDTVTDYEANRKLYHAVNG